MVFWRDQCLLAIDQLKRKIWICFKISFFDVIKLYWIEGTLIYRCKILLCQRVLLVSVKCIFCEGYSFCINIWINLQCTLDLCWFLCAKNCCSIVHASNTGLHWVCIKKKIVDYLSFTDSADNFIAFMRKSQNTIQSYSDRLTQAPIYEKWNRWNLSPLLLLLL